MGPDNYVAYLTRTRKGPKLVEFQKDKFNTPKNIELTQSTCSPISVSSLQIGALIRRDREGGNWFCMKRGDFLVNALLHQESDGTCTIFETGTYIEEFVFLDSITVLLAGSSDHLSTQLNTYNLRTRQLRPFFESDQSVQIQAYVQDMLIARDSTIWIATENGLWRIDQKGEEIQRLDLYQGFEEQFFFCLHEDKRGTFVDWYQKFRDFIFMIP